MCEWHSFVGGFDLIRNGKTYAETHFVVHMRSSVRVQCNWCVVLFTDNRGNCVDTFLFQFPLKPRASPNKAHFFGG